MGLVGFDEIDESDAIELHGLIEEHAERTDSPVAARILANWAEYLPQFKKVMPHDYKRALREMQEAEQAMKATSARGDRGRRRAGHGHAGELLMGKIGGFLEIKRVEQPERDPAKRIERLQGVRPDGAGRRPARPGRALHGVRRAVLPQRLPAREPDPGLERPRLPRPLARGDRPAARDEQLPGVHRQALPRPCEAACVLEIREGDAVSIKQIEVSIVNRAWDEGWIVPQPPEVETGRTVAVIGAGPAGLAAAQQLRRAATRSRSTSATSPAAASSASACRTSRSRSGSSSAGWIS